MIHIALAIGKHEVVEKNVLVGESIQRLGDR
jgi:hypothetical protein